MNNATKTKYRPVLTAAHIEKILELAKTEKPGISDISVSLIGVLAPFKAKIDNAGIEPAYTIEPTSKANVVSKLGGALDNELSKEDYWERCYNRVQHHGTKNCTLEEIEAANEHKYLHDLMNEEESEAFESRSS